MTHARLWCAVLVFVASLGCFMSRAAAEDREFLISSDPEFVLVKLTYRGGAGGVNSIYSLHADGRLTASRVGHDGTVFVTENHQIPAERLEELLRDITASGLLETSRDELFDRMGPKRQTFVVWDGSTLFLEVALQSYRGPGQESSGPARISLALDNPSLLASQFPGIAELQSLSRVESWFRDYRIRPERRR